MADYEASRTVDVAWNVLFDYLSDVKRLPEYLPQIDQAHLLHIGPPPSEPYQYPEPGETGVEQVDVDVHPEGAAAVNEQAWIKVVQHGHKLQWGVPGAHHYRGELAVDFIADGTSRVTVRLHTDHAGGPDVERMLEESLATIKATTEGRHLAESGEPEA
ncbi:SRPBCC family protein [Kribbella sp. NPDC050124]|uniref:SRPBCC family protein n=1 Tax=Kribbella sp. NPDC050124 TaxID=3364114 RepID=UPI0037B1403C